MVTKQRGWMRIWLLCKENGNLYLVNEEFIRGEPGQLKTFQGSTKGVLYF